MHRQVGERRDGRLDELLIGLLLRRRRDQDDRPVNRREPLGNPSMAGSNMQGPIICTASPQSVCGYSNGLPLATSVSGARCMKSSADATGGAPALSRIL